MDAEPRAGTPIPCGVGRWKENTVKNSWLMAFSKAFNFLLLASLLGLAGCASLNKPLSEEEREQRIRDWSLPMENPWLHNDE